MSYFFIIYVFSEALHSNFNSPPSSSMAPSFSFLQKETKNDLKALRSELLSQRSQALQRLADFVAVPAVQALLGLAAWS